VDELQPGDIYLAFSYLEKAKYMSPGCSSSVQRDSRLNTFILWDIFDQCHENYNNKIGTYVKL